MDKLPYPWVVVVSDGRVVRTLHRPSFSAAGAAAVEAAVAQVIGGGDPEPEPPPLPGPVYAGANIHERGPTALGGPPEVLRDQAKAGGYTGDSCQRCGNFTIKRTGTCTTCTSCGDNSGCG